MLHIPSMSTSRPFIWAKKKNKNAEECKPKLGKMLFGKKLEDKNVNKKNYTYPKSGRWELSFYISATKLWLKTK